MQRVEPFDKDKWRSCCGSNRPTRASMEKGRYKLFDWLIDWYIQCSIYIVSVSTMDTSLMSNIQKLFSEKIEVFGEVQFSKVSVLTGIIKISLKVSQSITNQFIYTSTYVGALCQPLPAWYTLIGNMWERWWRIDFGYVYFLDIPFEVWPQYYCCQWK